MGAQSKRRKQYRTIPVWVARITEHVFTGGKHYVNVITKGGKPRTLRMRVPE